MDRPAIPRPLERQVLVEAGHRCAIPACRQIPVEIAHIVPWAQAKEHRFDNLIALCPNCHARHHAGQMDRQSLFQYKANLALVNNRYGEIEQRVLRIFAENPGTDSIILPGGAEIMVLYLLQDGLLRDTSKTSGVVIANVPTWRLFEITDTGREFIGKWLAAKDLEGTAGNE